MSFWNMPLWPKSASPVNSNARYRWWVLVALALFVNMPNLLPWEQAQYPATYMFDLLERLLKCLFLAALYFSLFQRPWRAWLVLWVLCLWWMPVSLAVRFVNFTPVTSSLLGIFLESTPRELMEFFQTLPWIFYVLFVALNGLFFATYRWLRMRPQLNWPIKPRLVYGIPGFALVVLFSALALVEPDHVLTAQETASNASDLFEGGHSQRGSDLAWAYPYELGWAYKQHAKEQQIVQTAIAKMRSSPQTLHFKSGTLGPEIVVLVLGESSSRQDWQLFNPAAAATTPQLQARLLRDSGLLPFTNVVAQSTATRYAVPSILTDQPLYWPDGKANPNATSSILQIAQQSGFRTAWFSNQTSGGKYDGPVAIYAKEAQSVAFLNTSTYSYLGSHDEVLLPVLRRHLQEQSKAFVVLHTMGSHFQFAHRYPPEFERFQPAVQNSLLQEENARSQEAIVNAYRNSVLYTDHVLEEVIGTLEALGRPAVLVYVSDHGQGLAEPGCSRSAINRTMARAYEVPALVWLSSEYRAQYPDVLARLTTHLSIPYTTQAVYQTMVDLMEGQAQSGQPEAVVAPSFFSVPVLEPAQLVVSSALDWVDFQVAARRNRCLISAP